jgi:hypothetical protein
MRIRKSFVLVREAPVECVVRLKRVELTTWVWRRSLFAELESVTWDESKCLETSAGAK